MSLWLNFRVHIRKRYENEASNDLRFCSNPPKGFNKIGIPKKAMTLREQQLTEAERMKRVHN